MPRGELDRLRDWLTHWSLSADALQGRVPERLRFLNALESRFDELVAKELGQPLDWWQVRRELEIPSPTTHPWWSVAHLSARALYRRELGIAEIERMERLWGDFVLIVGEEVPALHHVEGWLAGLEYLVRRLAFVAPTRQAAIGRFYGVSASTVSLRYRVLVDTLGVVIFDHPARKRLHALRALLVESGRMDEAEFQARVLAGELV